MILFQEPVKKKGRTVPTAKVKEEPSNFLIKPKIKKPVTIKKDNPTEKSRSFLLLFFFNLELIIFCLLYFFVVLFLTSLYCPQFPGVAICNTTGEQTTQELHIQSSLPSHQHPKDETCAETEM